MMGGLKKKKKDFSWLHKRASLRKRYLHEAEIGNGDLPDSPKIHHYYSISSSICISVGFFEAVYVYPVCERQRAGFRCVCGTVPKCIKTRWQPQSALRLRYICYGSSLWSRTTRLMDVRLRLFMIWWLLIPKKSFLSIHKVWAHI